MTCRQRVTMQRRWRCSSIRERVTSQRRPVLVRSGSTIPVRRPYASPALELRGVWGKQGEGGDEWEARGRRRSGGGARQPCSAGRGVLQIPFRSLPPRPFSPSTSQAILSPNCAYMARFIQAPGEDTSLTVQACFSTWAASPRPVCRFKPRVALDLHESYLLF
uniref:Uncharacterized protein n=1 Tax=Triticum urartu TaxID=4572 RepID=A0A8R7PCG2_TRIUA